MRAVTATVYEPGYVIAGKYELEAVLGQGGMGAVWRARNVDLDSLVAIKVLRAVGDRAALRTRLVQEARAAAKLAHPAIVKVFDVGQTESGDPFIVMELLHGSSLGTILAAENRLSAIQAVRILLPIADAMSLAHSKNIVHRDIKPDNVFIVHDAGSIQPKLVDFGIVKIQQDDGESHLTQAGAVLGSPDYMSPEQARGEENIDLLTDVWAFSVVLYEAVAGQCPFSGANYNALLRQIVEDAPLTLESLAAGDAELSAIVMRGLSKRRADRYASMGEYGRALATWLINQGVHEDICGTTLEPRWLRGTDPHGRPMGRASLVSLTDAWPVERGSGLRANADDVNTIPAVPRPSKAPGPEAPPAASARPKWPIWAGIAAVAVGALAWFSMRDAPPDPAPPAASSTPAPRLVPAATEESPKEASPRPDPSAPAAAESALPEPSNNASAQGAPRKVSSPKGPRLAPRKTSPAPASAPKKGDSKPPADLISPYQ